MKFIFFSKFVYLEELCEYSLGPYCRFIPADICLLFRYQRLQGIMFGRKIRLFKSY